ncbi:MAG: MFS transporter [candidate division Zixibacteria bacterium]|nr:MFS transporter [candidate division Zixibacteria bacterium]
MFVIPWVRSTLGVVLPGMIAAFDLSIREAGLASVALETGSVTTMLALSLFIDRIGPSRVVAWGLPIIGVALAVAAFASSYAWLLGALVLHGVGVALTSSGVNAGIADTGARRPVYLGILHAGFSLFSIVTPLIAGVVLVYGTWNGYYLMVAGLVFCVAIAYRVLAPPSVLPATAGAVVRFGNTGPVLRRIGGICLGTAVMAGIQGVLITWSYLYMAERYATGHGLATLAPSAVWVGVLAGRTAMIWMSKHFSVRAMLLQGAVLAIAAVAVECVFPSPGTAFAMMVFGGIGVSGAYQLGTAWAAERLPDRIGAASTFVMASGALGIGAWPWLAGAVIETASFAAMPYVMLGGLVLTVALFGWVKKSS